MQLSVKNLGPIKEGAVNLSNKLTIFTGPNNTGKSYLTYLIYGISQYKELSGIVLAIDEISSLFKEHVHEEALRSEKGVNIKDILNPLTKEIDSVIIRQVSSNLAKIFVSSFINPTIEIVMDNGYDWVPGLLNEYIKVVDNDICWITEKGELEKIVIKSVNNTARFPSTVDRVNHLMGLIASIGLDNETVRSSYFFPAERTAINLFAKHITATKAEIKDDFDAELIAGLSDDEIGRRLRAQIKAAPKYPYAIRSYINFVNDFKKQQEVGEYTHIAASMETALTGGKLNLDEFDQLVFTPNNSTTPLELHLSSSLVKSLSYFILYLRYTAKKGDQVIIDEPEINLHPDLQIAIAKVIAQMVNAGLKVIISTHSDYLIKELNNLILLGELNKQEQHQAFVHEKGFVSTELLTKDQVSAYFLHDGTIDPIDLEENGLVVPTINEAIRRVDGLAEEIYMEMES